MNVNLSKKHCFIAVISILSLWLWSLPAYFLLTSLFWGAEKNTTIIIEKTATDSSVADNVASKLDNDYGNRVRLMLAFMFTDWTSRAGAYSIPKGCSPFMAARRLSSWRQSPIKITFNNIRTMPQLAERLTKDLRISKEEFLTQVYSDSVLNLYGVTKEELPALFLPDTYECYWNASAMDILQVCKRYYDMFWNEERKQKATALGLTPIQVASVASIVEEETSRKDERPMVARLYLNRLDKGMKLQADPTVKFAIGDFSIRRISGQMLSINSPYNTYLYAGLPPGPIRFAEKATIDAVLNAPTHPYIYMCAKEDFSGTHNFAIDYATHLTNARRYQAALNARGIK